MGRVWDAEFSVEVLEKDARATPLFEVNIQGSVAGECFCCSGRGGIMFLKRLRLLWRWGCSWVCRPDQIAVGLGAFVSGCCFRLRVVPRGGPVVDDYGNHSTGLWLRCRAARECVYGRVPVFVSAARYTRTRILMGVGGGFGYADRVEVLDIYSAIEEPMRG